MTSSPCSHDIPSVDTKHCRVCNHTLCASCRIVYQPPISSDVPTRNLHVPDQYQCRPCTITLEQMHCSTAIQHSPLLKVMQQDISFESHVPDLIAEFAIGHIVQCCNTNTRCDAEISISNRFDLQRSASAMDSDGNLILNVPARKSPVAGERTQSAHCNSGDVVLYGECRQIFCAKCNNPGPQKKSPFMMMMRTQRFKKNKLGRYEIGV